MNGTSKSRYIAVTGILAALAFGLQYIEFAIPIMPGFIKFDFSDLPALIGTFALGPVCGICVELIKNLLHMAVSQSLGVGELSNFVLGAVYVAVAGLIYKHKKNRTNAIIGCVAGAAAMAVVALPLNIFIIYPMYYAFMNMTVEVVLGMYQVILPTVDSIPMAILIFNVPFTFVKGIIDALITLLIYKKISPILHGAR